MAEAMTASTRRSDSMPARAVAACTSSNRELREQLKAQLWTLQAELKDEPHHSQLVPDLVATP